MGADNRGFSLIELIVVLTILGLLATIMGPRVIKVYTPAKTKIAEIQLAELGEALEMFSVDVHRYPTTAEGLQALVQNPGIENWDGPYLKKKRIPKDPWGRDYWSRGADGLDGGERENADVTSW